MPLEIELLHRECSNSAQIRQALKMELLSKLPDRSNNDSSLGMELGGTSPTLSSLVAARLLVYTSYCGCKAIRFQGYLGARRRDGIKTS